MLCTNIPILMTLTKDIRDLIAGWSSVKDGRIDSILSLAVFLFWMCILLD